MKKILFFSVTICLALSFMASSAVASDTMWAFKYRTWVSGYLADHTYVIVNNNGDEEAYANFGGTSGGDYLDQTYGWGEYSKLRCVYDNPSLCKLTYGVEGVCHQDANRLLYSSSKIVSEADGYSIFYPMYGDYGYPFSSWLTCYNYCE